MTKFDLLEVKIMAREAFLEEGIKIFQNRTFKNPEACPVKSIKKDFSDDSLSGRRVWFFCEVDLSNLTFVENEETFEEADCR
jgi:hypothetical protein